MPTPILTVTCHTDGCSNAEEAIPLAYDPADPPDSVVCGVCGEPITDVETGETP